MVVLLIKVIPSSGRQMLQWDEKNNLLKCYLKSAPEKNKANDELIKLFSKSLGIAQLYLSIIGGPTSRRKKIAIQTDFSESEIYARLGIGSECGIRQQLIK